MKKVSFSCGDQYIWSTSPPGNKKLYLRGYFYLFVNICECLKISTVRWNVLVVTLKKESGPPTLTGFCLKTHALPIHFRCILTLHLHWSDRKYWSGTRRGAGMAQWWEHSPPTNVGSISAASSGPVFLPERGIISRIVAGNRAYSIARLLSVVLSKTSNMASTKPSLKPTQPLQKHNKPHDTNDRGVWSDVTRTVGTIFRARSRASIPKKCAVTKQLFSFCSKLCCVLVWNADNISWFPRRFSFEERHSCFLVWRSNELHSRFTRRVYGKW